MVSTMLGKHTPRAVREVKKHSYLSHKEAELPPHVAFLVLERFQRNEAEVMT